MILLDTHVLLWARSGDAKLGTDSRRRMHEALESGELAVSVVTFWEVGWLIARGRLGLDRTTGVWRAELLAEGLVELPVTGEIAVRAAALPDFHRDPADRFIVASALDGHSLITADRRILDWPGQLDRFPASA